MHKNFVLVIVFLLFFFFVFFFCFFFFFLFFFFFFLNQIFSLFPTVNMNANYAEICRVGNLIGGRFSTSSACSFFLKFSQYCCETLIIHSARKVKIFS